MGRVIYAEEILLDYLQKLTKENSFAVGLIIGHATKSRDYVVHLARTPEERDKLNDNLETIQALTFNSVKEIEETLIADHAKHVTRMLPGGFCVLGAFICCPNDVFSNALVESSLKRILVCMKKTLCNEPFPVVNCESEKLLLHFNPADQKYTCKVLDVSSSVLSTFKQADWKFQNNCTKWCQISSKIDMNWPSIGGKTSLQLKTQLKNFLVEMNKMLDPAVIVFDDQVQNVDRTMESVLKKKLDKKNKSDDEHLEASIFTPLKNGSYDEDIVVVDCDVELQLMGILRSQVFVSHKSSVEEAVNAVKQDIVRSLAARLEMHWDSLIEEEYGSPEEKQSIHEPPRRVSITLPNSYVCFSDYIFPGEGANEVISTFKELLDVDITEENVNKEYERHGDPLDLCEKSDINTSSTSSDDLMSSTLPTGFLIAAISFAVVLIGIAIALQINRSFALEKKEE